ncbi:MAG: aminotransferase class V-fold PLP-dependent enzyme [Alphaproteobacteria bacterium]|nr:aminotransferase class V-fold PLP-dependent enzyme [Alphaproteobacteria bacterium]
MIPCQRRLFDLPRDVAFFRSAAMAPSLLAVEAAGIAGLKRKRHPWLLGHQQYFTDVDTLRGLFAQLIGASAEDIAVVPSASYGIGTAAANLPVAADQGIVVLAEQFPSNVYPWRAVAAERGARVVTVPRPADLDWTTAVLERIDRTTAVVALPQCHWTDGSMVDLVAVGARCRALGVPLVLDTSQSLGMRPLEVKAIQPDFLVNVLYKWLLGPYGMALLYVAPQHHGGRPLEHNWVNRAGSEDYSRLVNYRDDYQPGARRFDVGERGNFVTVPMAIAALRQMLAWGAANIAETVAPLMRAIGERAAALGLPVPPEGRRVGHMIGLRAPAGLPPGLADRLGAEGVHVSVRGDAIRIGVHVFNDADDVDRLFAALERTFAAAGAARLKTVSV